MPLKANWLEFAYIVGWINWIQIELGWIGLNYNELYWFVFFIGSEFCRLEFCWIGMNWDELGWIWLNWVEFGCIGIHWKECGINLDKMGVDCCELGWIRLNWVKLDWIRLNWAEFGWIGLNWINWMNGLNWMILWTRGWLALCDCASNLFIGYFLKHYHI